MAFLLPVLGSLSFLIAPKPLPTSSCNLRAGFDSFGLVSLPGHYKLQRLFFALFYSHVSFTAFSLALRESTARSFFVEHLN